jgi:hypothetical protein
MPLPATNEYGSAATLYLVAKDTGEWHELSYLVYDGAGSPATLFGPTVNPLFVAGTYDVYYCHNCATSTTSIDVSSQTDAADALPNGLRKVQSNVVLSPGSNHLNVDIPVTPLAETITLGGQPLPPKNEYGSAATLYLVARDTSEWHELSYLVYDGAGSPATLFGPTFDPRIVPGTYDVYYCHNCSTTMSSAPVSSQTDAADALPNGLRALRSCVTVP